jgi:CHAD domain-containing protein
VSRPWAVKAPGRGKCRAPISTGFAANPVPQPQLRAGESVRDGLVRIAAEWVRMALAKVDREGGTSAAEDLHQVRVTVKRLRALLRLVRPVIGRSFFRRENARLKRITNRLSPFRDAVVSRRTLENLALKAPDKRDRKAISLLLQRASRVRQDPIQFEEQRAAAMTRVRRDFLVSADNFENMLLPAEEWNAVGPGLGDMYRRARNRMLLAVRRGTDEAFHEWRKQVKHLYYQLQLLRPASPERVGVMISQLRDLEECLGRDHDLTVAAQVLTEYAQAPGGRQALRRAVALLDKRRGKLRREGEALGRQFFHDKPGRFGARLNRDWVAWRTAGALS